MEAIKATFAQCKKENRIALVGYFTAGYPTAEETPDIMLGLQAGGVGMTPCVPFGRSLPIILTLCPQMSSN